MGKDKGFDAIVEELGTFGKYNIVNYALLLFPIFLTGLYGSVFIFEAPDIGYRCKVAECETLNHSKWLDYAIPRIRNEPVKCKRYGFKEPYNGTHICSAGAFNTSSVVDCEELVYYDEDSAVKDFNLGCQDWKRTLIGTVHHAGLFISLPITGIISDKYGRKSALSIASFMNGLFGLLRSFSVNFPMMLALEFLEASFGGGTFSTAFVMAMELVGPKGRVYGNTIVNGVYQMGLMTLATLAWWLQSWRTLLRIIYTPAMLGISYLWLLNESVRWLLSNGRHHEAAIILKKAAKMNKVDLSEQVLTPLYELEKQAFVLPKGTEKEKIPEVKEDKGPSDLKKVIKSKIIRQRVLVCSFLRVTCTFVYYGLSINSVSLAGNKYVNFMLVTFMEVPANFICLFVLNRYGRKIVLIVTYVLSGCLCMGLSFLPKDQKWWSLALYLSGKLSITVAYSTIYIYGSEVFPTSVRHSMLAVCSMFGRIGSTLAPLTPLLALYYSNLPAILFGTLALVASILVFTLPETLNVPLPDTIEEAEALSQKKEINECS